MDISFGHVNTSRISVITDVMDLCLWEISYPAICAASLLCCTLLAIYVSALVFLFVQWSVLLPVVMTLIATQEKESSLVTHLADLCYPKWALEAFIIANAERLIF